jgi:L-seryl-tRNA(Ser) seleniumtransferase
VVSRSELVQIGGGFRMPDVMASSGAKLREIGTTNRVSFDDYYGAVGERTGMIAKIHWSNFKITGFTSTVDASKLADLGKERGVHVMYDLGSGSWVAPEEYGAKEEPSIRSAVSSGVDSVCFSGDKLLGGPQSGVILGSTETIEQLNQNPLYRAFRPNKVTLLLLEDLLLIYLRGDAVKMVPTLGFLTAQTRLLEMRADRICEELTKAGIQAEVIETEAMVGGGGAPEEPLQSYGVKLTSRLSPDDLSRRLRLGKPPVIGRIIDDAYVLDIKAVFKEEDDLLISSVREALSS